jgi:glycosyltransferase involved in cell wall biosynthesis
MRILILVDCYLPNTKSCVTLTHDLAVELARQQHDVVLMAPIAEAAEQMTVERTENFTVVRVRTGAIKDVPRPIRALRELAMPHMLWHASQDLLRSQRIDLVIYYSPSIFFAPLVRRVKTIWHCPAYLVLRDIFPKWARDCGVLKDGLVFGFFQREAIRQYDQADVIGVESEGNVRYFAGQLSEKHYKVEVLSNWMSLDGGATAKGGHRQRLGWDGKVIFFYGGNMGVAQGMESVVDLMRAMRSDDRVRFLLVGEGSEVPRIRDVAEREGLKNLVLLPPVDQHTYLSMLAEADVGVVSLAANLTTHNVPSKALPYMYFSLPILASLNPGNDLLRVISATESGFSFDTRNRTGLAEAARKLVADASLRRRLGSNARQLLESRFSAQAAAQQITRRWAVTPC